MQWAGASWEQKGAIAGRLMYREIHRAAFEVRLRRAGWGCEAAAGRLCSTSRMLAGPPSRTRARLAGAKADQRLAVLSELLLSWGRRGRLGHLQL